MLVFNKPNISKTSNSSREADNTYPGSSSSSVLVFKTTLKSKEDVEKIKSRLESVPGLLDWSVDRNDCDNVLRITGKKMKAQQIIAIITAEGYSCEVLA